MNSYDDLIDSGYVLDRTGRCHARYNGIQSIPQCLGVKSERGLYRVWISNLQKMIRRGRLNEAVTSTIECVETGKVFESNVINRLAKVIVSEDIGLACPTLPLYSKKFLETFTETQGNNKAQLLDLVSVLVECQKSRLVDTLFILYHKTNKDILSFSDSFLLWKQSMSEKCVKGIVCHLNACIETSQTIKKQIKIGSFRKRQEIYYVWEEILRLSKANVLLTQVNEALLYLYISQETNGGRKLNLIQACLNVVYADDIDWTIKVPDPKGSSLEWKADPTIWPWSISYDKHSILDAAKLGRDRQFFFEHGAKLENRTTQTWLWDLEEEHKI